LKDDCLPGRSTGSERQRTGRNGERVTQVPWEQRGNRRYYYRNLRRQGKQRRQYVGTGDNPTVELMAAADALRRVQQAIERRERLAEQAHFHEAESPLQRLCAGTDLLTRAALVVAGYYQHDRGAWRRYHGPAPSGSQQ
jgi:hypothetical protein